MRLNILATVLLISIYNLVYGQEPLSIQSLLNIETKGTGILVTGERNNIDCISCNPFFERISDNPFHHFAMYSGVTHTLLINNSINIETGIFLEERSFSGGSNTLNNWVVYPKLLLTGIDTLRFFNQAIGVKLSGGDFWNEDFNDMLRVHNIDYQGMYAELLWKKHALGFLIAGDLSYNIGLGLHQYHKAYLRSDLGRLRNTFSFADNQLNDWENHLTARDYNLSNNLRYKLSDYFDLESQVETRLNRLSGTSFAAGLGVSGQYKRLTYTSRVKYYQADFNQGYISNRPNYSNGQGSYVGTQLYPLRNYYRAYSQWGNYTQTQGQDLLGFELVASWEQPITGRYLFFTDLDLNIIGDPVTRTANTIPLYNLGLRARYLDVLRVEFFFTNKHMDLNNFYQTFQASRLPFFAGSVILDIDGIKLGEKLIGW